MQLIAFHFKMNLTLSWPHNDCAFSAAQKCNAMPGWMGLYGGKEAKPSEAVVFFIQNYVKLNLSHFKNGQDITAYLSYGRQDWNARTAFWSWENMNISKTDAVKMLECIGEKHNDVRPIHTVG